MEFLLDHASCLGWWEEGLTGENVEVGFAAINGRKASSSSGRGEERRRSCKKKTSFKKSSSV